jgi:hypothetical protein
MPISWVFRRRIDPIAGNCDNGAVQRMSSPHGTHAISGVSKRADFHMLHCSNQK